MISTRIPVVTPTKFESPKQPQTSHVRGSLSSFTTDNAHYPFKMSLRTREILMKQHLPTLHVLEEFGQSVTNHELLLKCSHSVFLQTKWRRSSALMSKTYSSLCKYKSLQIYSLHNFYFYQPFMGPLSSWDLIQGACRQGR